jgi:hypothetical protein
VKAILFYRNNDVGSTEKDCGYKGYEASAIRTFEWLFPLSFE